MSYPIVIPQTLEGGTIVPLRVYDEPPTAPDTPYRFFTVAHITDSSATIQGLTSSYGGTIHDLKAIAKKLYDAYGVTKLRWVHKGKRKQYTIKKHQQG
ncbi:MAG: hypothetical protein KGI54_08270 [Pseudomonadota bacterium]|nr:hypothetical protein [Pseudomonadota bacterium]